VLRFEPGNQRGGTEFQLDTGARCDDLRCGAGLVDVEFELIPSDVSMSADQVRALFESIEGRAGVCSCRKGDGRIGSPASNPYGGNLRPEQSVVRQDIDDVAVGVFDEEAADTPRLFAQFVNDLRPGRLGGPVSSIDVVYLDGGDGHYGRSGVVSHDAQLHLGPLRVGERDDPTMIHNHVKP
jgi:hypothetical protein